MLPSVNSTTDQNVSSEKYMKQRGPNRKYFIYDEHGKMLERQHHYQAAQWLSMYLSARGYDGSKDVKGLSFHFKVINGNEFYYIP